MTQEPASKLELRICRYTSVAKLLKLILKRRFIIRSDLDNYLQVVSFTRGQDLDARVRNPTDTRFRSQQQTAQNNSQ